jgi:acyl-CoA synthetase (AMP-forming)/AMP-acid ligase II
MALFVAANSRGPALSHKIHQICQETLARHQMPSHVEILDRLPLTASLKVDLHALTQRATRHVGRRSVSARQGTATKPEMSEQGV